MTTWRLFAEGTAHDDRWPDDFEKWKVERSARREKLAGARAAAGPGWRSEQVIVPGDL
jgi:hypothetical protein